MDEGTQTGATAMTTQHESVDATGSVVWDKSSGASARDEILARLALAEESSGHTTKEDDAILKSLHDALVHDYARRPLLPMNPAVLIRQMKESLEDYGAEVLTCDSANDLPSKIVEALGDLSTVVIPADAPLSWIRELMKRHLVYLDSPSEPLSSEVLDGVEATVTTSRLGIAPTGTIVLDGTAGQGRRMISLLPDTHVVVLYTDTVCATVPQAFDVLAEHPNRPMTWISGPSATSDIELSRVDGVHGPRNLKVILTRRTKK